MLLLESVPNFSEGRDEAVLEALRTALSAPARLLDVHVDPDHNRSVFTLVGEPDELVETLLAGIACARERIDLRRHEGVHPRIGAADVVPVVPIEPDDLERAQGDGAHAGAPRRRRARAAGLPLRRARAGPRAGLLPPGRPGGAAAPHRRRRARAGLRPAAARRAAQAASSSVRGGRSSPSTSTCAARSRRRARSPRSSARRAGASRACARSGSTCRARASSRSR